MKMKGFLALFLLVIVIVFFLFVLKTGKHKQLPGDIESFNDMKYKLTKTNMTTLERLITTYIANEGRTPSSLQALQGLYVISAARVDAWGTAIKYERISDNDFRLISAGKDRVFNTKDDLVLKN